MYIPFIRPKLLDMYLKRQHQNPRKLYKNVDKTHLLKVQTYDYTSSNIANRKQGNTTNNKPTS